MAAKTAPNATCGATSLVSDNTTHVGCQDRWSVGTPIPLGDDATAVVPLSSPFSFYAYSFSSMTVSSNGAIGFPTISSSYSNGFAMEPGMVSVFWDDLNPGAGGAVKTHSATYSGVSATTVEWRVPHYGGTDPLDVQMSLYNGSNEIRMCYPDTGPGLGAWDSGNSATVGIVSHYSIQSLLLYSDNSPVLTKGTTLRFYSPN